MKKVKLSEIATASTSDLANDYLLMHRKNEGARKMLFWGFSNSIEKGRRIPSGNSYIVIRTDIAEKSGTVLLFEITVNGAPVTNLNPSKVLIQANEATDGLKNFKAMHIGGTPVTVGRYVESGKIYFYMQVATLSHINVKAYNDTTKTEPNNFTLTTASEKPVGTEITSVSV